MKENIVCVIVSMGLFFIFIGILIPITSSQSQTPPPSQQSGQLDVQITTDSSGRIYFDFSKSLNVGYTSPDWDIELSYDDYNKFIAVGNGASYGPNRSKISLVSGKMIDYTTLTDCENSGLYTSTFSIISPPGLAYTTCVLTKEGDIIKIGAVSKTTDKISVKWAYLKLNGVPTQSSSANTTPASSTPLPSVSIFTPTPSSPLQNPIPSPPLTQYQNQQLDNLTVLSAIRSNQGVVDALNAVVQSFYPDLNSSEKSQMAEAVGLIGYYGPSQDIDPAKLEQLLIATYKRDSSMSTRKILIPPMGKVKTDATFILLASELRKNSNGGLKGELINSLLKHGGTAQKIIDDADKKEICLNTYFRGAFNIKEPVIKQSESNAIFQFSVSPFTTSNIVVHYYNRLKNDWDGPVFSTSPISVAGKVLDAETGDAKTVVYDETKIHLDIPGADLSRGYIISYTDTLTGKEVFVGYGGQLFDSLGVAKTDPLPFVGPAICDFDYLSDKYTLIAPETAQLNGLYEITLKVNKNQLLDLPPTIPVEMVSGKNGDDVVVNFVASAEDPTIYKPTHPVEIVFSGLRGTTTTDSKIYLAVGENDFITVSLGGLKATTLIGDPQIDVEEDFIDPRLESLVSVFQTSYPDILKSLGDQNLVAYIHDNSLVPKTQTVSFSDGELTRYENGNGPTKTISLPPNTFVSSVSYSLCFVGKRNSWGLKQKASGLVDVILYKDGQVIGSKTTGWLGNKETKDCGPDDSGTFLFNKFADKIDIVAKKKDNRRDYSTTGATAIINTHPFQSVSKGVEVVSLIIKAGEIKSAYFGEVRDPITRFVTTRSMLNGIKNAEPADIPSMITGSIASGDMIVADSQGNNVFQQVLDQKGGQIIGLISDSLGIKEWEIKAGETKDISFEGKKAILKAVNYNGQTVRFVILPPENTKGIIVNSLGVRTNDCIKNPGNFPAGLSTGGSSIVDCDAFTTQSLPCDINTDPFGCGVNSGSSSGIEFSEIINFNGPGTKQFVASGSDVSDTIITKIVFSDSSYNTTLYRYGNTSVTISVGSGGVSSVDKQADSISITRTSSGIGTATVYYREQEKRTRIIVAVIAPPLSSSEIKVPKGYADLLYSLPNSSVRIRISSASPSINISGENGTVLSQRIELFSSTTYEGCKSSLTNYAKTTIQFHDTDVSSVICLMGATGEIIKLYASRTDSDYIYISSEKLPPPTNTPSPIVMGSISQLQLDNFYSIMLNYWSYDKPYRCANDKLQALGYRVEYELIQGGPAYNMPVLYTPENQRCVQTQSTSNHPCPSIPIQSFAKPAQITQTGCENTIENTLPFGIFEGLKDGNIVGWAFDADDPTKPVNMRIEITTSSGLSRGGITIAADHPRPDLVQGSFIPAGNANHGFIVSMSNYAPADYIIKAFAVDPQTGKEKEIRKSGQIVGVEETLETDLKLIGVKPRSGDPYAFDAEVCLKGPKTLSDVGIEYQNSIDSGSIPQHLINKLVYLNNRQTITGLDSLIAGQLPFGYSIRQKLQDVEVARYSTSTATNEIKSMKDGACAIFPITIATQDERSAYDQSGKIEIIMDPDNVVNEASEDNNKFVCESGLCKQEQITPTADLNLTVLEISDQEPSVISFEVQVCASGDKNITDFKQVNQQRLLNLPISAEILDNNGNLAKVIDADKWYAEKDRRSVLAQKNGCAILKTELWKTAPADIDYMNAYMATRKVNIAVDTQSTFNETNQSNNKFVCANAVCSAYVPPQETDFELKSASINEQNFQITAEVCGQGSKSIGDFIREGNYNTFKTLAWDVIDSSGKVSGSGYTSTYPTGIGIEAVKGGACDKIITVLQPSERDLYTQTRKLILTIEGDNLIRETNEANNKLYCVNGICSATIKPDLSIKSASITSNYNMNMEICNFGEKSIGEMKTAKTQLQKSWLAIEFSGKMVYADYGARGGTSDVEKNIKNGVCATYDAEPILDTATKPIYDAAQKVDIVVDGDNLVDELSKTNNRFTCTRSSTDPTTFTCTQTTATTITPALIAPPTP